MTIHPKAHIGLVSLRVTDLERSLAYYQDSIGLRLLNREENEAWLGTTDTPFLYLQGGALSPAPRGHSGLYHFAILLPSRPELARAIRRLSASETPLGGASDHLVSEALYLSDPDGNGIEIYRDRPRNEWQYSNDSVRMDSIQLDFDRIMAETPSELRLDEPAPPETIVGHIHLHVSDLAAAGRFYQDVLGFEDQARDYPNIRAGFVSAGGYHHHIGYNTWAGTNIPPAPETAAGLNWYEIVLPDEEAREAVVEKLAAAGIETEVRERGIFLRDPSQNGIYLTLE